MLSISIHFLLLLVDLTLSKYASSIFILCYEQLYVMLGRFGCHEIPEDFFFRQGVLLFHFTLGRRVMESARIYFFCLLSVCRVCLHSVTDDTFGTLLHGTIAP